MKQSFELYAQKVRSLLMTRNCRHELNTYGVSVGDLTEYYDADLHPAKAADRIMQKWGRAYRSK